MATAALSVLVGLPGCAAVLGIEDPIDLQADADAGDAGLSPDTAPSTPCTKTCAGAPPAGWDGPFSYYEATGGPPAPAPADCGGEFTKTAYDGTSALIAPPPACTCQCGAATGATCSGPLVNYFSDATCMTSCGTKNQPLVTTPACTILGDSACSSTHATIGPPLPTGGSCPPMATSNVTPAAWSTTYRLCAVTTPPSGTCGADQVCVPSPSLPEKPNTLCIARPDDAQCPAAYPVKKTAYASFTDNRACSACTCAAPQGVTCATDTATMYTDLACTAGAKAFVTGTTTCLNIGTVKSGNVSAAAASGGTCTAVGGQPTGAATPTSPTTICCTM